MDLNTLNPADNMFKVRTVISNMVAKKPKNIKVNNCPENETRSVQSKPQNKYPCLKENVINNLSL